jgi:hypothetical protein
LYRTVIIEWLGYDPSQRHAFEIARESDSLLSPAHTVDNIQRPVMALDDLLCDDQTEPSTWYWLLARKIDAKEWLGYAGQDVFRYPRTLVFSQAHLDGGCMEPLCSLRLLKLLAKMGLDYRQSSILTEVR